MTPIGFAFTAFACSVVAGLLGSLLGVGGGVIVVPSLTLLLGVDIRFAIGASIVSVIATSSGAAPSYVRTGLSNIRVGMFLEVATTAGALCGAFLAGQVNPRFLYWVFSGVMVYTAVSMLRYNHAGQRHEANPDRLADRLAMHSAFRDGAAGREISYRVGRTRIGLVLSYLAGVVSGLLGVGGGVIKVPVMNLLMGMPLKAASATSNFMIGVTGAASAGVYFSRGEVDPLVTGPVAIGVLLGSTVGSRLLTRIHSAILRIGFILLLAWVAVQMFREGLK